LVVDAVLQRGADGGVERGGFAVGKRVGLAEWVQPRSKQRLIRVDVADSCDKRLVEQQRLERDFAPPQPFTKDIDGKGVVQRLRPERRRAGGDAAEVARQKHLAELSRVGKAQLLPVIEAELEMHPAVI